MARRLSRLYGLEPEELTDVEGDGFGDEEEEQHERAVSVIAEPNLLRRSKDWACIKGCGACCKLGAPDRMAPEEIFFEPADAALYRSMIGDNGWCKHYDQEKRLCSQYEDRPWFCRNEPDVWNGLFGVPKRDLDDFLIDDCRDSIKDVYGHTSQEAVAFEQTIGALQREVDVLSSQEEEGEEEEENDDIVVTVPVDPLDGSPRPDRYVNWEKREAVAPAHLVPPQLQGEEIEKIYLPGADSLKDPEEENERVTTDEEDKQVLREEVERMLEEERRKGTEIDPELKDELFEMVADDLELEEGSDGALEEEEEDEEEEGGEGGMSAEAEVEGIATGGSVKRKRKEGNPEEEEDEEDLENDETEFVFWETAQ
uniref:Zinc-or iron-chelating domain-containing protein n=1 Tax=Chromera velia CCMP2878 TaxID=1169474 RepID=A0A0G4HE97_9ALVE|eukprot:Cvel_6527.t1-p1 / transcript=Cvel_6527.t1 / gene=Cvel_6527 / organism=Chromera_velia_CCMP2878 / gene_product=hypothetical protein / transcript_product=hypothetical protein / location=Cvel_scaffold321:9916-11641(+) / protein_length=368 / sequence_SO=supercontig / SO=protein_coding / is_pseudo=false